MSETIDGGLLVIGPGITHIEPNRQKITVDLKQRKIFADGVEIPGIREFVLRYEPGHKQLSISRFKVDESGRPMAEFGALFEQDLNFVDDQFEIVA